VTNFTTIVLNVRYLSLYCGLRSTSEDLVPLDVEPLQSISCCLIVSLQDVSESHLEITEPNAVSYLYVKHCKMSLLSFLQFLSKSIAQSPEIYLPFLVYILTATLLDCMQTECNALCC